MSCYSRNKHDCPQKLDCKKKLDCIKNLDHNKRDCYNQDACVRSKIFVANPGTIQVVLNVVTLDSNFEQRLVTININELLQSNNFFGIYQSLNRFQGAGINSIYYLFVQDATRNTAYVIFVTGTLDDPYLLSFGGVVVSTFPQFDAFEINIISPSYPAAFTIPALADIPGSIYKKIKGDRQTDIYAVSIQIPGLPLLQSSEKLRQIDDKLYRALQKIPIDSFFSVSKNLDTYTYQILDFISASYTKYATGDLRARTIAKLQEYKERNVVYTYDIKDIYPTGTFLLPYALTTIITKEIHRANFNSYLTINGFKNEWSVLNGQQQISIWYSKFMAPTGWVCADARENYLLIYFDSRNLPVYDPCRHGCAQLSVIHRKISENMEYGELRAVQMDIQFEMEYTTHNNARFDTYIDPATGKRLPIRTYKQLLEVTNNGTYGQITDTFLRLANYGSAAFYAFPFFSYTSGNGFALSREPSLDPVVFDFPTYDIPQENYLVQDTIRYPYFQIIPNATAALGFIIRPSLRPAGQEDPLDTFFSGGIVRDLNFYDTGGLNNFSFPVGLIRPELVNGKRIGYWRIIDEALTDPFELILNLTTYIVPQDANPSTYYAYLYVVMFAQYLQSLNLDGLIIDTRLNFGGTVEQSLFWLSVIGATRRGWRVITSETCPNGKPIDIYDPKILAEFGINTTYEGPGDFPYINYDETPFIANALKNINVSILISRLSASGGDIIVSLFYGDKLDGNVGAGVNVKVYGELNGTLTGYRSSNTPPILDKAKISLGNDFLIPISPATHDIETGIFLQYLNTCEFSTRYIKEYQPDVLMSFRLEDIKRDVGILPPCGNFTNGPLPNPTNPATWRDSYIETALKHLVKDNYSLYTPPTNAGKINNKDSAIFKNKTRESLLDYAEKLAEKLAKKDHRDINKNIKLLKQVKDLRAAAAKKSSN